MSFFGELKRRNVVRVGIAYLVIGWLLAQVADLAFDAFGAPDWVLQSVLIILLLGLPPALFFAWVFEITPEGVKREKDVDRSQSTTSQTGRKLDFIIIGVLTIAVALLVTDKFFFTNESQNVAVDAAAMDAVNTESTSTEFVATDQSIAVLPFVNMSDDKDYFADGLSEELLNLLANIPQLKVAGRTSSFAFKGKADDLREIGAALGVANVLVGSIRRSGDRLRVTAQLIKVDDGFNMWSDTYERQMADIFDIQDDVAGAIVNALQIHLAPQFSRSTVSAEAYAFYLEALPHIAADDNHETVFELLDRALELDPEFAKAHEAKAFAYWSNVGDNFSTQEAIPGMYQSATSALELDPDLVVAKMLARVSSPESWSWQKQFDAYEEATRAAPNAFNVLRAMCDALIMGGYLQEAAECTARMVEIEPLSPLSYWQSGMVFRSLGRYEEATASFERGAELGGNLNWWDIAFMQLLGGNRDAAAALFDKANESGEVDIGGSTTWNSETLAHLVTGIAEPDTGRAFLQEWVNDATAGVSDFRQINDVYSWYLAFGFIDDYWQAINDIGLPDDFVWTGTQFLIEYGIAYRDSGFTQHPAFLEYARITGLTDVWDERGPPDFCSKVTGEWVCE